MLKCGNSESEIRIELSDFKHLTQISVFDTEFSFDNQLVSILELNIVDKQQISSSSKEYSTPHFNTQIFNLEIPQATIQISKSHLDFEIYI